MCIHALQNPPSAAIFTPWTVPNHQRGSAAYIDAISRDDIDSYRLSRYNIPSATQKLQTYSYTAWCRAFFHSTHTQAVRKGTAPGACCYCTHCCTRHASSINTARRRFRREALATRAARAGGRVSPSFLHTDERTPQTWARVTHDIAEIHKYSRPHSSGRLGGDPRKSSTAV